MANNVLECNLFCQSDDPPAHDYVLTSAASHRASFGVPLAPSGCPLGSVWPPGIHLVRLGAPVDSLWTFF